MDIRSVFTRNPGLKLVSLFLALLLELYFYSPVYYVDGEVAVGVELSGLPASSIVVSPLGYERGLFVKVQLRGPAPLVEQTKSGQLRFRIQYYPEDGGRPRYMLNPSELKLPSGLQVVAMSPNVVEFQIEPLIQKELLVLPRSVGKPAEGYQVQNLRSFPMAVLAQGPKSELDVLEHVYTKSIDVVGLQSGKRVDTELEVPGRMTRIAIGVVSVEIDVQQVQAERLFSAVDVEVLAPPGMAASADRSRVEIVVGGSKERLTELSAEVLRLQADARSLPIGKHRVRLGGKLPQDVSLIRANPETVTVTVVASGRNSSASSSGKPGTKE